MEIGGIVSACFIIALLVSCFIFIHKDHKAWIKSEAEAEALKKHKKEKESHKNRPMIRAPRPVDDDYSFPDESDSEISSDGQRGVIVIDL